MRLVGAKTSPDDTLVSIVMPARNCDEFVGETIASVLAQQYRRFELIVIDDASTDRTLQVVRSFVDPRIRILENETNLGVARSLLKGIGAASGELIARMDADDVCLRSRLRRQVRYMKSNPHVGIVGGSAILIGQFPPRVKLVRRRDRHIKAEMLFRSPMIHPSVLFRKSAIPFWYDPSVGSAEDYALWVRLSGRGVVFANLALPVIRYRMHSSRTTIVRATEQHSESDGIRAAELTRLVGSVAAAEITAMSALGEPRPVPDQVLAAAAQLVVRMVDAHGTRWTKEDKPLRQRAVRELAALAGMNIRKIVELQNLDAPSRKVLQRLALSNLRSVAAGLWFAVSRYAVGAVRSWGP